jgi:hypothetical protein
MFFKYLFLSFVFIGGCGWVGEKPPLKERPNLDLSASSSGPSCQIDFNDIKNHFEKGALTEEEIIVAAECAISALEKSDHHIEPNEKGALTRKEIEILLNSKIILDSEKFHLWIDRLFSIRDLLLREGGNVIHFSEIKEILKRVERTSQKISSLSKISFSYKKTHKKEDLYWELRKKLFSGYIDLVRAMFENNHGLIDHDTSKTLLLKQYQLWEGLEDEVGSHYIQAGYLANRMIFGESEENVVARQMPEFLTYLESVYHLVTQINRHLEKEIWSSKDSLSFLDTYQSLFQVLLKAFFDKNLSEIKRGELTTLLELLHTHIGGKASNFVTAVFELKMQLFGGNPEILGRDEIKELLKIFDESIDIYGKVSSIFSEEISEIRKEDAAAWLKANDRNLPMEIRRKFSLMISDFEKTLYFWTIPFQKTEVIRKHPFTLTQVAFVPIDRIISAYDKNGDGNLSMVPLDPFSPAEIGDKELTSFLATLQKLVKGLDMLTEGSKKENPHRRIWTNPLDLDIMTLGKILMLLSDQMLYNSNGDDTLDRYEIIETTSFILENHRAVTWFYWDPEVIPFHHQLPNSKEVGLLRQNLVESLKTIPTLQWYFPVTMKVMSEKDIIQYIEMIIQLIGRDHPQIISVKELSAIFMIVRTIEHLFLRFDNDQNGILNKSEIRIMYKHFGPIIEKLVDKYNSQPGAIGKIPVFGAMGKFLSILFNHFLTPFIDKKAIYKRVFEYSLSFGKLPEFSADLLFSSSKISSDRLKVVSLIAHVMKEYLKQP